MRRRRPGKASGPDLRTQWRTLLRENLEIGVEEDGHHFVWLEGLGLYGAGENFEEARRNLLRQFDEAIDERLAIGDRSGGEPPVRVGEFEAQTLEQTVEVLRGVIIERNRLRESLRLVRDLCERPGDCSRETLAKVHEVAADVIG
jgi:hypothetical protein